MSNIVQHRLAIFWLAIILVALNIGYGSAVENANNVDIADNRKQERDGDFVYVIEGRTDPFRPFITPKAAQPAGLDPNEIIDEQKVLSGLQLLEPGQLTLVGILNDERGAIALVEDQTKKGYILKNGVAIGKRGVVSQIDNQQVTVTETSRTRAGQEITNTLIMKLNKEGDK